MKTMLDDRAKSLLKTLVERYIADGQPVGSRTLSRASGLELSPATIRNVMADLEELGLIASPHTSAGRVPTARGYRLFVDTMLTARPLDLASSCRPRRPHATAAPRPAAARDRQAAQLLSSLSQLRGRGHGAAQGQRVPPHRVPAPGRAARAGDPGRARRRRAEPRDLHRARPQQGELVEATNYLNAHYAGLTIEEVRERLQARGRQPARRDRHADAGCGAGRHRGLAESSDKQVVVSASATCWAVQDFGNDLGSLRRCSTCSSRRPS
jgi:heat-inducible transcriptional repressor